MRSKHGIATAESKESSMLEIATRVVAGSAPLAAFVRKCPSCGYLLYPNRFATGACDAICIDCPGPQGMPADPYADVRPEQSPEAVIAAAAAVGALRKAQSSPRQPHVASQLKATLDEGSGPPIRKNAAAAAAQERAEIRAKWRRIAARNAAKQAAAR